MATAGKITVAEVEQLVEPGQLDPDHIITPGVYVQRIIHVPNAEKKIEQRVAKHRPLIERLLQEQEPRSDSYAAIRWRPD